MIQCRPRVSVEFRMPQYPMVLGFLRRHFKITVIQGCVASVCLAKETYSKLFLAVKRREHEQTAENERHKPASKRKNAGMLVSALSTAHTLWT